MMAPLLDDLDPPLRLAVAGLIGLTIGVEREWSGHASGARARFAGARTFFLLGLVGGIAGWLAAQDHLLLAGARLLTRGGPGGRLRGFGCRCLRAGLDADGGPGRHH